MKTRKAMMNRINADKKHLCSSAFIFADPFIGLS